MGGRGNAAMRNTVTTSIKPDFKTLPESDIKSLKPTKRAEEVFTREYASLRVLAKRLLSEGEYNAAGYNTLHNNDEEAVFSQRMLQGMQAKITSEFHGLELGEKLGVGTAEQREIKRYALIMMQKMLTRYYNSMYKA